MRNNDPGQMWLSVFGIGIFLLILGLAVLLDLSLAQTTTRVFMGLLAVVAALSGFAALGTAFFAYEKSGVSRVGNIALGLVYLGIAGALWKYPTLATEYVTAALAAMFVIAGAIKLAVAITSRRTMENWGLVAVTGLFTFLFGAFLWTRWPAISAVFIGMYVALEVISMGLILVLSGLALRLR